jgi:hypothetical protein
MSTKRIWIITEVVNGGQPSSRFVPADTIRQEFDTMVRDLGYLRDDDHAFNEFDPDRNHITLDYIDIPA